MAHLMLGSPGVRVVVAGSGTFAAGSSLPDVGSVAASVRDLGRCLVERAGLDPDGLTTLIDPADPVELGKALVEAAKEATDALVFCFVGHGLVGSDNELYLATYATVDPHEGITQHQALPYPAVRQALARCAAPHVLVILDCCFSGRATPDARDAGQRVLDATPRGTYLLAAAGDQAAWAPEGERHTAFTGALVELLTGGDPTAPGLLTLDDVYRCLARTLPERGFPAPRRQATDQGDRQILAPNPAAQATEERAEFSPYRGLAAFGPEDADYFFGRTELTRVLVDRVARQVGAGDLLVVTGPSGSGKSSLLRAGLIPSLRRAPGTEIAVMTPGSDPVGALAERFADLDGSHPADLRRRLESEPGSLVGLFRKAMGTRQAVVIVDQFEEVFTACADEERRRVFIQALHALSGTAAVVAGVRADFFGHCAAHAELVPALEHAMVVGPMTSAQLRQAIEGPARRAGLTLQPGLIELILEDLGPGTTEPAPSTGAAVLPLLSHALLVTWQHREDGELTMGGYRATGGIREALARTADATLDHLDLPGRQSARLLLTRLIGLGEGQDDTRRSMPLAELLSGTPEDDSLRQVLDRFVRARLLTVHADTAQIAHEALIRAWPQLRLWIESDRAALLIHQELGEDAAEWLRHDRDPAFLYRGTRLSAAQNAEALWRTDPGRYPALTDLRSDFLRACQAAAARRFRRRRLSVLALVLLLITAVTGFATTAVMAARAEDERARSLSRQLAAQSENIGDTDIDLARRLSTAAWHMAPTGEARLSLLKTLQSPERAILRGHTGPVERAEFNRDGSRLITYGENATARLWDGNTGRIIAVPRSRSGRTTLAEFSSDGSRLFTVDEDGVIGLWSAETGEAMGSSVRGRADWPVAAFSPDGSLLATGDEEGVVRIVDSATGDVVRSFADHEGGVLMVAFAAGGSRLITSGEDTTVRVRKVVTGKVITTIEGTISARPSLNRSGSRLIVNEGGKTMLRDGSTGKVIMKPSKAADLVFTPDGSRMVASFPKGSELRSAATGELVARLGEIGAPDFSPDGSRMATTGYEDTAVRIWSVSSGKVLADLEGHAGWVTGVQFSPDGSLLATASSDGSAQLWDARTGKEIAVLKGHTDSVESVVFSPDGSRLATSGEDRTVRLWDGSSGEKIATLTGHTGNVGRMTFSPDGSRLVTASEDLTARIWDTFTGRAAVFKGHTEFVFGVAINPDGSRLATVDHAGIVNLWDTATRRPMITRKYPKVPLNSVAFNRDGSRVAVTREDGAVEVLDGRTGQADMTLKGHTGAVRVVAFQPAGSRVITAGEDGTARLWESATGKPLAIVRAHSGTVFAVAYRPDGARFATVGSDGAARLWDGSSGKEILSIRGHADAVYAVAFSPDGSLLATGGNDGIIRLWDAATGKATAALKGHSGPVRAIAFSPDGTRMASAGEDATIHLWDRATGRTITTLAGHTAAVNAVAFGSDGRRLVSAGEDMTVRMWEVPIPAGPFTAACELLAAPMTKEEWSQYLPDDPYERVCP
ncbi:WD40 repeat [Nonomuraea solani]|uniref:WD40 repeat n=1 Tax=Nonomuraea solani TaxID=1144553 RepID=A0A1H6ERT4_9ACTN|nr:WD40 repeat domain-containing protein [Nonomuraea solani]SEG99801.1 WD40 repeat [Nonomuraea solani]